MKKTFYLDLIGYFFIVFAFFKLHYDYEKSFENVAFSGENLSLKTTFFIFIIIGLIFLEINKEKTCKKDTNKNEDDDKLVNKRVFSIISSERELFKGEYNRQLELMKFNATTTLALSGPYIVISGILLFFANNLEKINKTNFVFLFYFFFGISLVFNLIGIYYLINSLVANSFPYRTLRVDEIERLIEDIWKDYIPDLEEEQCGRKRDDELKEQFGYQISRTYIEQGEESALNNAIRFESLMVSKKCLSLILFPLFVLSIFYFYIKLRFSFENLVLFFVFCLFVLVFFLKRQAIFR